MTDTQPSPHLSLEGISKRFGEVVALDSAQFRLARGTVHALLGENGAGKTTLMRIAFGILEADAGVVRLNGTALRLHAPADAIAAGIRMVQQHFSLVPGLSAAENFSLGGHGRYDARVDMQRFSDMSLRLGVTLDAHKPAALMTPAEQQQLEIIKALGGDCRVLILDEPTALLAPTQADALLKWLRSFADAGHSAILITHKLRDALAVADDVTVLRHGRTVLSGHVHDFEEQALLTAMLGASAASSSASHFASPRISSGARVAALKSASAEHRGRREVVSDASLEISQGEILGVAGLERSGHRLLLRVLAARHAPSSGSLQLPARVAFIPEDVRAEALADSLDVRDNVALRNAGQRRGWIAWRHWTARSRLLLKEFAVKAPNERVPVALLSGGNQQKLVLARELTEAPTLIVAENPTRGLDVRAAQDIRERLIAARDRGAAIVLYSSDLDELIAHCDRIMVMYGGKLTPVDRSLDVLGRALLGAA